jgi:hypothetical protein
MAHIPIGLPPILIFQYEDYLWPERQLIDHVAEKGLGNLAIWCGDAPIAAACPQSWSIKLLEYYTTRQLVIQVL